jgi:hypothetical protein
MSLPGAKSTHQVGARFNNSGWKYFFEFQIIIFFIIINTSRITCFFL